ncbi:MAG: hypothetical protein OSA97_00125 [Nevskia sp.]|nr:hypothetical protein [Nevskia sp.]
MNRAAGCAFWALPWTKLMVLVLSAVMSCAFADSSESQPLKLVRSAISRVEGTDGKPTQASSFAVKDHIYYFTEVSWDDTQRAAGKHQLSYKWYTGNRIAFSFADARDFPALPNFWSAWISGGHLGPGHHKVELYVDNALFDSQEFDILDVAQPDELQIRDSIKGQAADLLKAGDFVAFDQIATQFRQSGERTPAGDWKLAQLYIGVKNAGPDNPDDPQWQLLDSVSSQWLRAHPDSPTAVVVRAKVLLAHAWAYRGGGYASEVTESGSARYHDLMEQARDVLDSHKAVAASDPEWDAIRIDLIRQQGGDSQAVLNAAAEALGRQPYYYPIHNSAVMSLMPKWGGSEELLKQYVQMALDRSAAREGTQAYARIYHFVARNAQTPLDDLNTLGAKWQPMQQSLDEILRAYPDSFNRDGARAMACWAGQAEYYKSLGRRTSLNTPPVAWWDTPEWRRDCDQGFFEGKTFEQPASERLQHYSSFLQGFGTGVWRAVGLTIVVVTGILELALAIAGRNMSGRRENSRPAVAGAAGFDPSLYPRTYRFRSGSRWIGTRMAVRMLVLGSTVAVLFWTVPWPNRAEVLQVFLVCIAVALLGAAIILRRIARRVILHAGGIELHDLGATQYLRRDQIAGCKMRGDESRVGALVLVPNDTMGKNLRIDRVSGEDDAYRRWFSSLPRLDP